MHRRIRPLSVFYFGERIKISCLKPFLNNFRLVNVLDLEGTRIIGHFPQEVTLMVHIRYLAITCSGGSELPESIANLWNLQFWMVYNLEVNHLPKSFWQMKSLRQVHIHKMPLALPWSFISTFEQLPKLEVLKLVYHGLRAKRWDVKDGTFLNLKYLKLQFSRLLKNGLYKGSHSPASNDLL
ncbi:OLC1v1013545C1 [Oldenlandia corymbosa var. corymbosa]|uniref:OLC1v1013545C1 n=1 Tax=Oldenlandia corymbosa var. corymbosa TaxID=529605 RepID=A0AAV1E255_OLDCO|nr:OLC1v1013545C1 [Oldenlandia corymbosa var. corymbosa]